MKGNCAGLANHLHLKQLLLIYLIKSQICISDSKPVKVGT